MPLKWNQFCETGFNEFDEHTRELFARIDAFVQAIMEEKEAKEIDQLFTFLDEYISLHFHNEENMIQSNEYPDLPRHKALHDYFKRSFRQLKADYDNRGTTEALVHQIHQSVVGWLMTHVTRTDKEWSDYVKKRNQERLKLFKKQNS